MIRNPVTPVTPVAPTTQYAQPVSFPIMRAGGGLAAALPLLAAGSNMPQQRPMPSYQVGGMVGPMGQPVRPAGIQPDAGMGPQAPIPAGDIESQIQMLATRNPAVMAQIKQAVDEAVMTGELTQEELNIMVQLATTVMRNPQLYPQIRAFAIQQGLATEEDLSPTYDQGLVVAVLIAARAAQADVGGQNMMAGGTPAMAGSPQMQSLRDGGRVRGGDSAPVVIEAHTGEYVIPKHIVDMKGREFFDNMLKQYAAKGKDE